MILRLFKDRTLLFFLFSSLVNLHGYSVQVITREYSVQEYSETRTDTVRSVRSGGYAHDFHSTESEVRAQTIETVTAFV